MTSVAKVFPFKFKLSQLRRHGRDKLHDIGNHQHVGYLANRGVFVFVDGDDEVRFLHPCQMLDGTAHSTGDVQFGANGLAGGPYLMAVLDPTGVDDRATGTQFAAKGFGERLDGGDVVFFTDPPAGGDDDFGFSQVDVFGFGRFVPLKFQTAGGGGGEFFYLRDAAGDEDGEGARLDGDDGGFCLWGDGSAHFGVAAANFKLPVFDGGYFGDLGTFQAGGYARCQVPAVGGVDEDDVVGVFFGYGLEDECFVEVGVVFSGGGNVGQVEPAAAGGECRFAAYEEENAVGAEFLGKAEEFVGGVKESAFTGFAYE